MRKQSGRLTMAIVTALLAAIVGLAAPAKVKLRGYITAQPGADSVQILDDVIHFDSTTQFVLQNAPGGKSFSAQELTVGLLIEAEGYWGLKHQFWAQKITSDANQFDKVIKETAYLEHEPSEAGKIAACQPARLKVDGEILVLDGSTRRAWQPGATPLPDAPAGAAVAAVRENASPQTGLAGRQVSYQGMRRPDGLVAAEGVELGVPAPPDAYKMPHNIEVVRAKDAKTGIDILEFRRGSKVEGRLKLFPVRDVQEYVSQLGSSLLPAGARGTSRALEFRFFVVEQASINASALPDGTVLVNTGLLGAVENEAQLAFVLSHEVAHVLQAHYWREVHETRSKRILLVIAALAGGAFIGDLGLFLGELGLEAVVNGYQRRLENQADRLGLQNIIERGYDPRQAPRLSRMMIERYGDRSTSKIWSDHDSSVLRGSFLTIQIERQYPKEQFDKATADTPAFRVMREAMGPVKIM